MFTALKDKQCFEVYKRDEEGVSNYVTTVEFLDELHDVMSMCGLKVVFIRQKGDTNYLEVHESNLKDFRELF